jgi:hypothetical protein
MLWRQFFSTLLNHFDIDSNSFNYGSSIAFNYLCVKLCLVNTELKVINVHTDKCIFVFTYEYMYVCMLVCMYVCMYICMYLCMYVCMYVCMYICMYVCMYVCMYIYICMYCIYVCMYICVCVSLPHYESLTVTHQTHTNIQTHTHTYILYIHYILLYFLLHLHPLGGGQTL